MRDEGIATQPSLTKQSNAPWTFVEGLGAGDSIVLSVPAAPSEGGGEGAGEGPGEGDREGEGGGDSRLAATRPCSITLTTQLSPASKKPAAQALQSAPPYLQQRRGRLSIEFGMVESDAFQEVMPSKLLEGTKGSCCCTACTWKTYLGKRVATRNTTHPVKHWHSPLCARQVPCTQPGLHVCVSIGQSSGQVPLTLPAMVLSPTSQIPLSQTPSLQMTNHLQLG